jgi:hypothetical protein
MQFASQILQGSWTEPVGWLLIVAGLVLAIWTLGQDSRPRLVPALGHLLRRCESRHSSSTDLDTHWQRLTGIVESGIARAETLPSLQAQTVEAIEAADDAMARLLAELMPSESATSPLGRDLEPTPAPAARPLAA